MESNGAQVALAAVETAPAPLDGIEQHPTGRSLWCSINRPEEQGLCVLLGTERFGARIPIKRV